MNKLYPKQKQIQETNYVLKTLQNYRVFTYKTDTCSQDCVGFMYLNNIPIIKIRVPDDESDGDLNNLSLSNTRYRAFIEWFNRNNIENTCDAEYCGCEECE